MKPTTPPPKCLGCGRPLAHDEYCPECDPMLANEAARDNGLIGPPKPLRRIPQPPADPQQWYCACGHHLRSHIHPTLRGRHTHCSRGCGCLKYRPVTASTPACAGSPSCR